MLNLWLEMHDIITTLFTRSWLLALAGAVECGLENEASGVVIQIKVPNLRKNIAGNVQTQGAVCLPGDFRADSESANIGFRG